MSWRAKYDGFCGECREPIQSGDMIDWSGAQDGRVIHVDCEPDDLRDEVPRPVCTKCFQMKAVSGACGCDDQ